MFEDSVNNTDIAENETWFETFWRWMDGWILLHDMLEPMFVFCD